MQNKIPYIGNVWQEENLANLAIEQNFAKLKPSKHHMHITYIAIGLYTNLPNFFAKTFIKSISPNIPAI